MIISLELKGILKDKSRFLLQKKIKKIKLAKDAKILDVLIFIGIPKENVALITVNDRISDLNILLKDRDKIIFYPPIGGG